MPAPSDRVRTERLIFVDALRGFALFGVFGANLMIFSGFTFLTEEQKATVATTAVDRTIYLLELLPHVVRSLAPIGQMALTIYLLQTIFGLFLFYGFMPGPHLMGRVGPAWLAAIWVAGYALQVVAARAWMRAFRFGPAEWLWRSLTRWQPQPIRAVRGPDDPPGS